MRDCIFCLPGAAVPRRQEILHADKMRNERLPDIELRLPNVTEPVARYLHSGTTSGNRMYSPPEGRIVHTQSSAASLGGHVTEQPYALYTVVTCPISWRWALMDRRVLKRQMMGGDMNDHSISCPRKSRCSTRGMTSYHLRHTDILLKLDDASNIRMRMSSGKLSI